jgi:hypothetical protein
VFGGLILKAGVANLATLAEEQIPNASNLSFTFQAPVNIKGWSVS